MLHAIRANFWVELLHKINKEHQSSKVQEILDYFNSEFNLSERQLLGLIKLAALFHDSARQGEGEDVWEKPSADNFKEYLYKFFDLNQSDSNNQQSLELLIKTINLAIFFKDKKGNFNNLLKSYGLEQDKHKNYDYIRQLIHDADCLDIIRCNNPFDCSFLEIYQQSTANEQLKEEIHNLINEVHRFLHEQGDLLFKGYYQLDPKATENYAFWRGSEPKFQLKSKVKFEHAENVYLTILEQLGTDFYFSKFFEEGSQEIKQLPKSLLYLHANKSPEAGFNPFIHGTNSSIFTLFPKTGFKLQSAINMMQDYQLAPMSGEIRFGGFDSPEAKCFPCFGRLKSLSHAATGLYNKEKIMQKYAKTSTPSEERLLINLDVQNPSDIYTFNKNFIPILIDICRLIELGYDIKQIINIEEILAFRAKLNQINYFALIVFDYFEHNSYISCERPYFDPKDSTQVMRTLPIFIIDQNGNHHQITYYDQSFIISHFAKVLKQLENFDMRQLWEQGPHKEPEKFEQIIKLLSFPEPSEGNNPMEELSAIKDITNMEPAIFNLFKLKEKPTEENQKANGTVETDKKLEKFLSGDEYYPSFSQNYPYDKNLITWKDHWLFRFIESFNSASIFEMDNNPLFFPPKELLRYSQQLRNWISIQDNQFSLLEKLVSKPVVLSEEEKQELLDKTNKFPVILCHESEEKMYLKDLRTQEYRSKDCDILLGEDIKVIATDNEQHKDFIISFLRKHGFQDQVKVVLFDDLQPHRRFASVAEDIQSTTASLQAYKSKLV